MNRSDRERLDQIFAFAREADKEKQIGRQTYLADGSRKENDAEHAWHMALMIMLLGEYANEKIDVERAVCMALIHDLVEIYAGDTYAYDEKAKETQKAREAEAADRLFGMLPEDLGERLRGLYEEFEERTTPEARFVKAVDNAQPLMLNDASEGKSWIEHGVHLEQVLARNEITREGSEKIWEYVIPKYVMKGAQTGALKAEDYLVRATAASAQIRAFAVTARGLTEQARKAHGTSPIATAALGRTMCGALMMADMLKGDDDLLTIRISGDGPLGGIVVTADSHGGVKGYVHHPEVILPPNSAGHLNVGGAVGKGTLTVLRDLGLKDPYVGTIALRSGEIAEDLTYYYAVSEQIPSSVGLGVLMNREDATVKQAGGFIVQLMPNASEETIAALEQNLASVPPVTAMLEQGMRPEEMLEKVLAGMEVTVTETIPVTFSCACSADRCERGLLLLGKEELGSMIADNKPVTMRCQFCGREYTFSVDRLKELLEKAQEEETK